MSRLRLLQRLKLVFLLGGAPPSIGFLKLKVDGAMKSDKSAGGIGGGQRLTSFPSPIGSGSSIIVEILAIKVSLEKLAASDWLKKSRLIIECDNKVVVDWMQNLSKALNCFPSLISEIARKVEEVWLVVRHVSKIYNIDADCLAKRGIG